MKIPMKTNRTISKQPQNSLKKILSITLTLIMTVLVFLTPLSVHAATQSSKVSNPIGNMLCWSTSCKYGDYIYYSIYGDIYRINVKTFKKETVLTETKAFTFASMNISKGWIYCTMNTYMGTGGESCYIYKVRTNGKDGKTLAQGNSPTTINGSIYYIAQKNVADPDNTKTLGIYKMKTNGKNKTCIKKTSKVSECVSDGKKLYYSTWTDYTNKWYQMNMDGKSVKKIGVSGMNLFDIENGYLYYATYNYDAKIGGLYKQKLGSSKSTKLLSSSHEIYSANVDNGWIYYHIPNQNITKNIMYKMKTNGTSKKKLLTKYGLSNIMIHGNYIYYKAYSSTYNENSTYNTTSYLMTIYGKKNTVLKRYYES